MKCVITGHTSGIGKNIYKHFQLLGWEVVGVSRSNGFDLNTDINRVVELADGCDLFINCASVKRAQIELLNALYNRVGKMIVFGSVAGDFNQQLQSEYSQNKHDLATRCRELSLLPSNKILHLNISMLEDAVSGDVLISYNEVLNVIDFWLANPRLTEIKFEFKLTPFTLENAKSKFGISQESLDRIVGNMCDETKSGL